MTLSGLTDKSHPPTDEDLRFVLGKAHDAWARLIVLVTERIGPISEVWAFTSANTGWGLRLRRNERIIVYMMPGHGQFLVSFALGEKAVAAANAEKLPASVLKAIDAAPRYAEGRGVRFEVRQSREVVSLAALAKIKSEH